MPSASIIRERAREALKDNFLNVLLIIILVSLAIGVSSFLSLIVAGPLMVGLQFYLLNVVRRNDPRFEDLFHGFQNGFATSVIAYLLKILYVFLFTLLLIIPGIIKAYQYALVEFVIADDPSLTASEALEKSTQMMRGNKLRLFFLQLSFIGWYILCVITFGIALIYVIPYYYTAVVAFYQDLKSDSTPTITTNDYE